MLWLSFVLPNHPALQAGDESADQDGVVKPLSVKRFLEDYCLACHGSEVAEAERDFLMYRIPLQTPEQLIATDEIISQLTLKHMPPEDAKQPSDDQRIAMIDTLQEAIADARESLQSTGGRTVLRRLSNREYENTLASLFGRRVDTLGLTASFPKDNLSGHFDNIGQNLVTSGFLLDQYFQAAERLVETRLAKPSFAPRTWHFKDNFVQYEELTGSHKSVFNFEYLCLYEQPNTDTRQGGYGHIEDFLQGVPVSGMYEIEVHAQAMHRDTHYDPNIFKIDFSEPFQLGVVPGDVTKGHIHYPQAIEPLLDCAVVPDDHPEWLKFRVWLEVGQTPRFIFPNGPFESRESVIQINKRYKDEFDPESFRDGVVRAHILREGALPHIRIGEIKIHGPLEEPDGSAEEIAVFGKHGFQPDQALQQLFAFAERAYRKPLNDADQAAIESMYLQQLENGVEIRQAALDTIKLVLCSPEFLYFSEITRPDVDRLNAYDLATRLSYALWAGPTDARLYASAESGRLRKTKHLKRQIQRMLKDPRSDQFVAGFLDSWLGLREIGNLPPPRDSAREYYAQDLPTSMKQETRLFFRDLLDNNESALRLLDADYTFADKKLAELYSLPERNSWRLVDGFQKVNLDSQMQRGGLLGMASVLTASANGVETSPVTRGVWVSENILGIKPPPPPDDVPSIDANVSGAKTIREKLALHSQDSTCANCHRKIDPLGYGLENFDPIGRWRDDYPKAQGGSRIDASGQFPSGEAYADFSSYKSALATSRSDRFARNLIEKLLVYATGRHMERADQYEIDDLLENAQQHGYALNDIVVAVLTSRIFRSR
ncbi:MAG: DUF1592 domain-containing protein [Planctomycetales bacterium]|nr:DUF1592 domain-containing protein [Planctomycetales bacterium]